MKYRQIKHGLLHGLLTKDQFRLTAPANIPTRVKGYNVHLGRITLTENGNLFIDTGYTCDGASGPTWDTASTIGPAFVHDALYELIAAGLLPRSVRWQADGELWYWMRSPNLGPRANFFRAAYYLFSVEAFGWLHV